MVWSIWSRSIRRRKVQFKSGRINNKFQQALVSDKAAFCLQIYSTCTWNTLLCVMVLRATEHGVNTELFTTYVLLMILVFWHKYLDMLRFFEQSRQGQLKVWQEIVTPKVDGAETKSEQTVHNRIEEGLLLRGRNCNMWKDSRNNCDCSTDIRIRTATALEVMSDLNNIWKNQKHSRTRPKWDCTDGLVWLRSMDT